MNSSELFAAAQLLMPGGVNSPVRAFNAVGANPLYVSYAEGAYLYDMSGRKYLDMMQSWGPLILGHAPEKIVEAVKKAAEKGLSYGACHEDEVRLARLINQAMPQVEMLRLVNSGTEATMSALRLARAATGRDKVIKFRGCYHGHGDSFLIEAGSGALTQGSPSSPGVTAGCAADTLLADYNDLSSVEKIFAHNSGQIAAIIVEPIAGNMGLVLPAEGFLPGLRKLCDDNGALLIFDEVISGFRCGWRGAGDMYNVKADLTTLGKIIGGGMPLGAYGGRKDLLEMVSPSGKVYQAGTLSGNPVACAAGIATLDALKDNEVYAYLEKLGQKLEEGMRENLKDAPFKWALNRLGSSFTLFFGIERAEKYADIQQVDADMYGKYFRAMLVRGVYLPPAQFECNFLSRAHTDEDIDFFLQVQKEVIEKLQI